MIQIESVTIREMRGIRELEIKPNRESFVISGPNGSGKSGIVDAIQFALTGEMSRLSGKGTGGLSVNRHGPHVDRRDDPSAAEVSIRFFVPELNQSATLTRNVKTSNTYLLDPNSSTIRAVVEDVSMHPELTLSRREIIKYIIVEAGERSKEIQALLKLEEIGQTRGLLKTVSNKLSIGLRSAEQDLANTEDALRRHLDVTSLRLEELLAAVNPHRQTLGLSELKELTATTDFSLGATAVGDHAAFPRDAALRDIQALDDARASLATLAHAHAGAVSAALAAFHKDRALLTAVEQRSFVERGITFLGGPRCPLCDLEWSDEKELRAHLRSKVAKAQAAEPIQDRLLTGGAAIADAARSLVRLIEPVVAIAERTEHNDFADTLRTWATDLSHLARGLGSISEIIQAEERLNTGWAKAPPALQDGIAALRTSTMAVPDQTSTTSAQVFLARAQDRLNALRAAQRSHARAFAAVKAGNVVYKSYCDVADAHLTALYKSVEEEFAGFYRAVNTDDEDSFKARLSPAEGGLDLQVAFYDKGMFPPGAYHSEGHQDGMGVCLYLALMKQLLGSRFRFALFDDVVMSVDQGHRKQFCRLLRTFFPDTQFIITTHDKVWAKQLQNEGVVSAAGGVAFHTWSVQTGPVVEQATDIWERIEADIDKGDIEAAAARLRRHLEYVSGELADSLGASPRYRADLSYELGDLFPTVLGRHSDLLKQAAKAANSWNNKDAQAEIEALKQARTDALAKHAGEAWVVNRAVHYNEWAQFDKKELRDVVNAFRGILDLLRCAKPDCDSWLYVVPPRGDPETLRCRCGAMNINLRSK